MKDYESVMNFTSFCTSCAVLMRDLNLTDKQLIRLCEECLVMAEYFEYSSTQMLANFSLGKLCQKIQKFREAISYLERVLTLAVQTNNTSYEAYAYGDLGFVNHLLGNSNQGLLYVKKCLEAAITLGMRSLQGTAYQYLGVIYHSKGEYQTAINCHQKQLAISRELKDKVSEGSACYRLGITYWSLNMYEEAKKWYKNCLSLIPLMNNNVIEVQVYEFLSMIYQLSGKFDKSIKYSEKLLHLVKDGNDDEIEARVYGNLGDAYFSLGKVDEAIEYYTKQLVLAEKMDHMEEIKATAHFKIGGVLCSMRGNYYEGAKHFETLLPFYIKTGDKKMQAYIYFYLGSSSQLMSKYDEAIAYLEKALSIAEELDDKETKWMIYGNMGMVFESLGEYHKALKYCLDSLSIAKETGNIEGQAVIYERLGIIYTRLSKFHESFQCYEKVLDLQKETGFIDDLQNNVCGNMGNVYKRVGNNEKALKHFQMYLRQSQKKGYSAMEASALASLSTIYDNQGKHQEAIDCSKKSLKIAQEMGDKKLEGDSLRNLGHIYLQDTEYSEALKCFERSLVIAQEIGSKQMELDAYSSLGYLYDKSEKYEKAIDYYEKTLRLAITLGDKGTEISISCKLGTLYYIIAFHLDSVMELMDQCSGNILHSFTVDETDVSDVMDECKKHLEHSLQCCEWVFDHLHDRDEFKITIMDTFITTYKLLTSVMIKKRRINEALLLADRGRARALSDLLKSKYCEVPQGGKNIIQTYAEVDSVLRTNKSEYCVLYFALQLHAVAVWVLAHQKPVVFLEVKAQGFQHGQLPTSQGEYAGSEIISEVVSAAYDAMNVRSTLSCEDRSLDHLPENVQLVKSDDFLVKGDGQNEGASRAPDQYKQLLHEEARHEKKEKGVEGNANPLETLYTNLIAPVMSNLTHEEVVIVPDGPLYMVPFAALRNPETGLFLSQMKRIRLVPSLTTLKSLQECPADYHSKTGALVVGDPDAGTVMFQAEETTFGPLPKARHEAEIIGNILNVEPLIGAQATKDVIMRRLHEGVAVIHIAAHGSAEGEIVLAPSTLTGGKKIPEEEDYMLTMNEVQKTGIKAQLVVLSCCHSGRGEIRAEGIVGISRGFLAAGARAVVASQWAIEDEATLMFMVSFYTSLKMGESASKSLQQAIDELREYHEEPNYWAPFFLIGDDVTISV